MGKLLLKQTTPRKHYAIARIQRHIAVHS